MALFQKAERSQAKARIALISPAGRGKTHSALLLASGLTSNGRIALIDTENGSSRKETGKDNIPPFDIAIMHAPFTVEKYITAIHEAEESGFDVLIIDSLSHSWAGTGGLLDQHAKKTENDPKHNSYTSWLTVTPKANELVDAILQSPIHIIATMRSKTDYALENGTVLKLGMAPIARADMDYEFDIVFDIGSAHTADCSKDRLGLFNGNIDKINKDTGEKIKKWLSEGDPIKEMASNIASG
jgi:hypothetical protein